SAQHSPELASRTLLILLLLTANSRLWRQDSMLPGLVNTLKGPGPFTVFAPTDDAFAKLPPGTLDDLLKPENKGKLTAILTYHVVPGALTSRRVQKLTTR